MKFVCPSCKAKYQIADERVAGRSVKMKCRKCGDLITIGASASVPPPSGEGPATEEVLVPLPSIIVPSGGEMGDMREGRLPSVRGAEPLTRGEVDPGGPAAAGLKRTSPAKPASPAQAASAVKAGSPVSPIKPVAPAKPLAPAKPAVAANPAGAAKPAAVAKPALTSKFAGPVTSGATTVRAMDSATDKSLRKYVDRRGLPGAPAVTKGEPGAAQATPSSFRSASEPPKAPMQPRGRPPSGAIAATAATGSKGTGLADPKTTSAAGGGDAAPGPGGEGGARPKVVRAPARPAPRVALGPSPAVAAATKIQAPHAAVPEEASATDAAAAAGPVGEASMFGLARQSSPSFPDSEDDERTVVAHTVGALAGAFTESVKGSAASALEELNTPADDWYAGINGVPAGPMRLGELRSKAASGAITLDSLVWRDGFDDWQPVRSFPELVAILEESISSAHAAAPPGPMPYGRSLGVGVGQGAVVIRGLSDASSGSVVALPDTANTGETSGDVPVDEIAGLPRRTSPAAWLAVAGALVFGVTVGSIVFSDSSEPQTIVKYVEIPAPGAKQGAGTVSEIPSPGPSRVAPGVLSTTPVVGVPKPVSARPGEDSAKVAGQSPSHGLDLQGLRGGGPQVPGREVVAGTTGQPLDQTQVQRTVSRYTGSVKRSCWQPALDTREHDAPTSARVSVSIRVGPTGSVENVTTSGDPKGYRGLSNCIGARVRGWQFPASSGTTSVNVPFVFAAQ